MTDVFEEVAPDVPVTEEEKEQILRHALGLIREPESWTTGRWKCPMPEYGPDGSPKQNPKTGQIVQRKDDNDRPLYQYCIHGALNQATYDILGEERAIELGAFNPSIEGDEAFNGNDTSQWGVPAHWLGIDRVSAQEYGSEAMGYNDEGEGFIAGRYENEEAAKHHQGVLHILRTRLSWWNPEGGKAA